MKTVIRYAGGKSKAIKKITPYIEDYDRIVSPFIGGGSLEVYWASELDKEVIGYDIFDMLVNFWNTLLNDNERLSEELSKIDPTPEEYNRIKEILMSTESTQNMLKDWSTDYYKRDDIVELDNIV